MVSNYIDELYEDLDIVEVEFLTEDKAKTEVKDGMWFVTDIHLKDSEMRTTKGAVENSSIILDNIYNKIEENESIKVVVLAGDIQDKIPKNRKIATSWKVKLNKIKELLLERNSNAKTKAKNLTAYIKDKKVLKKDFNPLISLKGNHDMSKSKKYTFFDEISDLGIVGRYDSLVWDKTQYNLYDYGTVISDNMNKEYYKRREGIELLVGLFHDTFLMPNSPKWVYDNVGEGVYLLSTILEYEIDLALTGHIHEREQPLLINEDTIFWQVGCIARTSYTDRNKRDEGFSALIDNETAVAYCYDIPVMKWGDYFTEFRNEVIKERDNKLKNFNLNLQDNDVVFDSYEEEIRAMNVEEDVKEGAIEAISNILGE